MQRKLFLALEAVAVSLEKKYTPKAPEDVETVLCPDYWCIFTAAAYQHRHRAQSRRTMEAIIEDWDLVESRYFSI